MKRHHYLSCWLLLIVAVFNACRDEDLAPAPDPIWAPVAVVNFMEDPALSFIDATDIANSVFAYELTSEDFDKPTAEVASVVVNVAYNGGESIWWEEYAQSELESGKVISLTGAEAANLFGLTPDDLRLGDVFTFIFSVKTVEGRHHTIYNNNICNLIRVVGDCELQAHILNPAVVEATTEASNSEFSLSQIATAGNDEFMFVLDKRDFSPNVVTEDVTVEVAYLEGATSTISEFKALKSYTSFPAEVSIVATEAAALFDKEVATLANGDEFVLRFVLNRPQGSFTGYDSPNCGESFSSSIVHPLHYPFSNPDGTAIAPPATPLEGTCSLTIPVNE